MGLDPAAYLITLLPGVEDDSCLSPFLLPRMKKKLVPQEAAKGAQQTTHVTNSEMPQTGEK
jgi:hypothetical protein